MEMRKSTKVLLVDDHALFLEGMRNFLTVNGIDIAGTARSGPEALLKYEMTKPDLVLMDLQMSQYDGIEATRQLKKEYPGAVIVMLTAYEDEASLFAAMQAGASGYLVKGMEPKQFLLELAKWSNGEIPLAPGMASRMLKQFSNPQQVQQVPSKPVVEGLTERQTEVLRLVARGRMYKEIAQQLDLKEVTVKYHIREVLAKLNLDNRSELIVFAAQRGLV